MTEQDEDRTRPEETTARQEEQPVPSEGTPLPAAGDVMVVLSELAGRFGQVEEQITAFHRRSAHRESIIDRLHEENQRLRGGNGRVVLEPVVADLIRLYDQLDREASRAGASGQNDRLLRSFAEDVAQILDRCGYEAFSAEPGDSFDHNRHRPLAVVPCADESRHNTVAQVVIIGFIDRGTGRIRRPVHARFHQYSPDAGSSADTGSSPIPRLLPESGGAGHVCDKAHFQ